MNNKLLLVLPLVLLAAGCATCNKNKMQDLETRVNALENKSSGEATAPAATTVESQTTSTPAANEVAVPETPTKKDIQTSLKNAGFYTGEIDEKFGHKTKKAIEEFQKANGLKVDGKVGPNTWNKLKTYYSAASATETK